MIKFLDDLSIVRELIELMRVRGGNYRFEMGIMVLVMVVDIFLGCLVYLVSLFFYLIFRNLIVFNFFVILLKLLMLFR